ncbi:MarR family transcriptional regulator [Paenibacillus sp. PK3_47]|uniref:MarR family winged helix-turn-helix transcriptional regulator n=1 Tax=Paenibacillus sp. PK3_47 TaxID=2072642 RepID=UPI00201D58BE|nr:MarR family transcriptional regulator [Paenibacillus sp. PK3_47]UQZ35168.1 MarR family transcriptional regulator [Paenibacillus sp. PK3_47]
MSIDDKKSQAIDRVMDTMAGVQQKSQAFMERITKKESLSNNQIMLLFQLRLTGTLKITDISERFIITPGAASSMCDKLENAGLIERVRNKEDRRVVRIKLTSEGDQRILQLFSGFEAAELESIAATLQQIHTMMDDLTE